MYTKFIIVVDDDVNVRDWKEVIWALDHPRGPARGIRCSCENTPIDYLDFASPVSGLGSKMGIDATNKWQGETDREWGTPIAMDAAVKRAGRRHLGRSRSRPRHHKLEGPPWRASVVWRQRDQKS